MAEIEDDTANALWLPSHALACYAGDALLRSWLLTPGLLTERLRATCGTRLRIERAPERDVGTERRREVAMLCRERLWVFARTRIPHSTLAAAQWLGEIGDTPLGEAVAARRDVQRSPFEYAQLTSEHDVVAAALRRAGCHAQSLWVRRSTFTTAGGPFYLQEVFLPDVGRGV
ncbi:MAG: chorismate lyase [Steroidobacteraceae bacterium]|nr:chorismate lyase [Steroidobacteraceae bacterium]MDW8260837.1 chorismate lyase [Gammaproteobacteria bacterium]